MRGLEPLEDRLALSAVAVAGDGLPAIDFALGTQWQSGYCGDITILNDEAVDIDGWTLEFDMAGGILSIWNAEIVSVEGDHYTVQNVSWNNAINSGASVSFGFVSSVDASHLPESFVFNGQSSSPDPDPDPDPDPIPDPEPDPVPDDGDASVSFLVTSDWQSGFGGQITITNTSSADLEDWELDFDFAGNIGSIWNASIVEHNGDHYTIDAASWNSRIAVGSSVSFGFNGSRADSSIEPENFQLNGVPVGGDDGGDDDVETPPVLSAEDVRVSEADSGITDAVLRLELSKSSDAPLSVYYATSDGTATAGDDYAAAAGTVTFQPGETEKTVTLSVYGDTTVENTESFAVLLSTASELTIERSEIDVTIVNDDFNPDDGGGNRVLGYFAEWGIYGRDYAPMDIPAEDLTHVVYSFANISDAGEMIIYDTYAAVEKAFPGDTWDQPLRGNFNQLLLLKEQNPHLRTMIAVGGWTLSDKFSDVALTETSRETFAASAVEFIVQYGFDGIDFDWEYPGGGGLSSNFRPEDGANYVLLVQEVREQLDQQSLIDGKTYEISVASPVGFDKMANFQLAEMAQHIDWFNVMTYDYHGSWENTTNHQAALYASPGDPSSLASQANVDATIQGYLDVGIDPGKLNLGLPLYSRAWAGVGVDNNGLFQTSTRDAPGTWEPNSLDYKDVYDKLLNEPDLYTRHWDDAAMVPYVYSPLNGSTFMTYEDQESANAKIDYVMAHELGGVFFWELSADVEDSDSPDSLVNLAADRLLEG